MKNIFSLVFCLTLFITQMPVQAVNYWDGVFKKDSTLLLIRETQIGKNFFDAGNNKLYTYTTKLGLQYYCFQFGVNAEREFIYTRLYNQNYLQRTKALGLFVGFELPVTKKVGIGLVGILSTYKPNAEQPIYIYNSGQNLFDLGNYHIFQIQLRANYKLNKAFSLVGSANVNTSPYIYNSGQIDHSNFFRFNVGLRYSLYSLYNNDTNNIEVKNKRLKIFAGTNLEWKNVSVPDFIGREYTVRDEDLLQLSRATGNNVNSQVYALLGLADKYNNMILFGFNQREYNQFSKSYQQLYSSYNWKLEMKDISSRMSLELNLFSFAGEKTRKNFKLGYPFLRVTATNSKKSFSMIDGWDDSSYATNSSFYEPSVNNKAQTKSLEINNSLGLALKLHKLYLSAGINVFNRTYGEVKYERTVTRDYYENKSPQNYIASKTETLPVLEAKGWLKKPIHHTNVFFTIGLVL